MSGGNPMRSTLSMAPADARITAGVAGDVELRLERQYVGVPGPTATSPRLSAIAIVAARLRGSTEAKNSHWSP